MNALDLVRKELAHLDTPAGFHARVNALLEQRSDLSHHAAVREVSRRRDALRARLEREESSTTRREHTVAKEQFILEVTWHVPDMPSLIGPFEKREEARQFAVLNVPNGTWDVRPLTHPYLRES